MHLETVSVSEIKSTKIETISFREIPHQSKLFLDFQYDFPSPLVRFYPENQTKPEDFAGKVLANYKVDRGKLCDALSEINISLGAGSATLKNIELLRESDCVTVVTGQQAGLFSGALYTIYKALSAVKMAENLRERNIKAVPVFWIAEEDHDFDEIKKTFVLDKEGKLAKTENTPAGYMENLPVGLVRLDATIEKTIEDIFQNLPRTEFSDEIKNLLSATYKSGETYSSAFGKLLTEIFKNYGLILLSPLNKKIKELGAPIFVETVENSAEILERLLKRNTELKKENYHPQVLVGEDAFPFFWLNEKNERIALRQNGGKIKAQKLKAEFEIAGLIEIAQNSPEKLSPNALLRPVVQDFLLPTICYFGGAAEIAYFAQNSVIYETLNRPVTPIFHRASLTVIEPKHRRTLERYNLKLTDLFRGKEKILSEIVEKFLSNRTAREFAEIEEIINTQLNRLDRHLLESEPTLSDNLANRRRKILWHIGALRKKYHRAEIFKNEVVSRRIETLFSALLPENALQERSVCAVTFLNSYGGNFIEWIYSTIETDEKNHRILFL